MSDEKLAVILSTDRGGERLLEQVPEGHVIHTLVSEHRKIIGILRKLDNLRNTLMDKSCLEDCQDIFGEIHRCAELLLDADNHHLREEEVVCLELERRGISGPPEVMRQEHKLLRPMKERLLNLADEGPVKKTFATLQAEIDETTDRIISNIVLHIQKENNVLYPLALEKIDDPVVWDKMREQCDRIGYCSFTPGIGTS
ncbi:MAG: hemerythrin domain-containing protein, partial [Candidatus Neomarinimicrobiota bacterium]